MSGWVTYSKSYCHKICCNTIWRDRQEKYKIMLKTFLRHHFFSVATTVYLLLSCSPMFCLEFVWHEFSTWTMMKMLPHRMIDFWRLLENCCCLLLINKCHIKICHIFYNILLLTEQSSTLRINRKKYFVLPLTMWYFGTNIK